MNLFYLSKRKIEMDDHTYFANLIKTPSLKKSGQKPTTLIVAAIARWSEQYNNKRCGFWCQP